jgi:flagellar export protein FliJ
MTRDPLEALLRLRRLTANQARRELADCLRAETEAERAVTAIETEIERETVVATSLAAGDAEVEAYATWLRRIRPVQRAAKAAEATTLAETTEARTVLAMARAAERAVEDLMTQHADSERLEAERRAQREIDEVAQRVERHDSR